MNYDTPESIENERLSKMTTLERQEENNTIVATAEAEALDKEAFDDSLRAVTVDASLRELSLLNTDIFDHILESHGIKKTKPTLDATVSNIDDIVGNIRPSNPSLAQNISDLVLVSYEGVVL